MITALFLLPGWLLAQESSESPTGFKTAPPIRGTIELRGGQQGRFTYYFNHNALKDCVRVGPSLIALTESGNLLRFDAKTLSMNGQAIIPGRATTITLDGRERVLIGTQEGQISEVDPTTLSLKPVATAQGRIVWLSGSGQTNNQHEIIVSVIDDYPEVLPWPGEPSTQYDARSARLERKQTRPYFVAVYTDGKGQVFPFQLGKNFAIPNTFLLDDAGRLWMGTDKGEWGGECSYMDLHTGKVHTISVDVSGVLGFLKSADGRVLAYGGTSHMGMHVGYVAQIEGEDLQYVGRFESNDWKQPVPEKVQQVTNQSNQATDTQRSQIRSTENTPRGPIDLMINDVDKGGFWVVSAQTLYRTDSQFSEWSKVAGLGGRWYGGRRYSVGNTPTVNQLIIDKSRPEDVLVVMGRDGFERVSEGKVERQLFVGQLESSIIDIWKSSIGTVFVADDEGHAAWRFAGDDWQRLQFFPDRSPLDQGADWYFAEPVGDDGSGLIGFSGDSISPGERDLVRLNAEGKTEIIETSRDNSSRWDTSFLTTSDGRLVKIAGNELRIRQDAEWREAGQNNFPDPEDRKLMLTGRRYVLLGKAGQNELFLDTDIGEFVQLTHKSDGAYRFVTAAYKNHTTPTAVFDAAPDRDGWFLIASAHGLFGFRLEDGQVELIPSPNPAEEIKSLSRDEQGRLWAAGDGLYMSSDEGKRWYAVRLPMLSKTYTKRVRPNPLGPGLVLVLYDQGAVVVNW